MKTKHAVKLKTRVKAGDTAPAADKTKGDPPAKQDPPAKPGNDAGNALDQAVDKLKTAFEDAVKKGIEGAGIKTQPPANKSKDGAPEPAVIAVDMTSVEAAVAAIKTSMTAERKEFVDRLEKMEAEQQIGGRPSASLKTFGEFVHDSDIYKNKWKNGEFGPIPGPGLNMPVPGCEVPSLIYGRQKTGLKSSTPLGDTELGALASTYRETTTVRELRGIYGFAQALPWIGVNGAKSYEYPKEKDASRYGYVRTTLSAAIDGDPTPVNTCTVDMVEGLVEGTMLRFHTATGMYERELVSITPATKTLTFAAGALDFDAAQGAYVTSMNFGAIGENSQKPYRHLEFELKTGTMKCIPMLLALTQVQLDSINSLTQMGETEMRAAAKDNLDWHVLYGDGTDSKQLSGFFSESGVMTYSWSSGESKDTRADAVFRAARMIKGGGVKTLGMNPNDWEKMALAKDSNGAYVMTAQGPVRITMSPDGVSLGWFRVRFTDAMKEGDFFVGDLGLASSMIDKERSQFAVGYTGNQFGDNALTCRYEDYFIHAIKRTSAYVQGEWDSQPA